MLLLAVALAVFNVFLLGTFEFAASNNSSFNFAALQLLMYAESEQGSLFKAALFSILCFQRIIRKMSDTIRGVRLTVQQLVCQNKPNRIYIVTLIR